MKVHRAKGVLPERDSGLDDLPPRLFQAVPLEEYQGASRAKLSRQRGVYRSTQGATITPAPAWAIEFKTAERTIRGELQRVPLTDGGLHVCRTARWAKELTGGGSEKGKWRSLEIEGPVTSRHLFGVVSSSWLVPFAIAHRYIVNIPARVVRTESADRIQLQPELLQPSKSAWVFGDDSEERASSEWFIKAQRAWTDARTDRSKSLVTERLDYQHGLSNQSPSGYTVVHTRSRSFYAAVLNPSGHTALGLPFGEAILRSWTGDKAAEATKVQMAGVVADNMLHFIPCSSKEEAYWMMGLFNSAEFNSLVMRHARGEPPGIYTLPAKVLHALGLLFDSKDATHRELAKTAELLEAAMATTIKAYLGGEKTVNLAAVDDTDHAPEVPATVSSALMRRLPAEQLLKKLNALSKKLCGGLTKLDLDV